MSVTPCNRLRVASPVPQRRVAYLRPGPSTPAREGSPPSGFAKEIVTGMSRNPRFSLRTGSRGLARPKTLRA